MVLFLDYFVNSKYNIKKAIYFNRDEYMEYLTVKEARERWNLTARMVNYYCSAGRIDGAIKKGSLWLIPTAAEKPADLRRGKKKR